MARKPKAGRLTAAAEEASAKAKKTMYPSKAKCRGSRNVGERRNESQLSQWPVWRRRPQLIFSAYRNRGVMASKRNMKAISTIAQWLQSKYQQ